MAFQNIIYYPALPVPTTQQGRIKKMKLTPCIEPQPATVANTLLEKKCLEKGLRITNARRIVLSVLEQSNNYMSAEDIYHCLMKRGLDISLSTIYSNMRRLVDAEIIKRRCLQSKIAYYANTEITFFDQLVDVESGRVIEFQNTALDKLKADIAQEHGFKKTKYHIELYIHPCEKSQQENNLETPHGYET